MVNTLLGDYFGSRLMSNIREDKGYTYGIGTLISELQKNRQAILLICKLLDDKNKSGTLDKIKSLFS